MRFWRVCSTRSTRRSAGRSTFATSHGRGRRRAGQRSSTPSKAPRRSGTCAYGNRRTTRPTCAAGRPGSGPLLADGIEVYAYFKHEDEPTAPGYARRLLELVAANNAD